MKGFVLSAALAALASGCDKNCQNTCFKIFDENECGVTIGSIPENELKNNCIEDCENALDNAGPMGNYDPYVGDRPEVDAAGAAAARSHARTNATNTVGLPTRRIHASSCCFIGAPVTYRSSALLQRTGNDIRQSSLSVRECHLLKRSPESRIRPAELRSGGFGLGVDAP